MESVVIVSGCGRPSAGSAVRSGGNDSDLGACEREATVGRLAPSRWTK
jgi:hypothetical protein